MTLRLPLLLALAATPAVADDTRQLGSHEHGVGTLNIAFDGGTVAMEFRAPGADIVGFEHAAESAEDRAAIDSAVATLARPLALFTLPDAAQCSVTEARAALEGADEDDHASKGEHDKHDHDHGHAAEDGGHSEFHAEYLLTCADPGAVTRIDFGYFASFPDARELQVQIVTGTGAQALTVLRDAPELDLRGMF
jgi:hypothetical protein